MGYSAPSAEDVYRYALRLDSTQRSITDRFSFSIVFVNDTSPWCLEFLQTYCIELCFRTADRIRFIFFSELPKDIFEELINDLQYKKAQGGLLTNILSKIKANWRGFNYKRNLDFEHELWSQMRPKSLYPLKNFEAIKQHLDGLTAIPGTNMSLRFAQKLGIGRFTPCMVIFSDIGELHVAVMPVDGMSPNEAYTRLRNWIDRFYETNQNLFQHWQKIESQIEELCRKKNNTLSQVQNWRDKKKMEWDNLRTISKTILLLEKGSEENWQKIAFDADRNHTFPNFMKNLFREYRQEVEKFDTKERDFNQIQSFIKLLKGADTYESISMTLQEIKSQALAQTSNSFLQTLKLALAKLDEGDLLIIEPREQLIFWLKNQGRRFPRKRYRKSRKQWKYLLEESTFNLDQEFEVILAALNDLPLTFNPNIGAERVITELSHFYSFNTNAETWKKATTRLFQALTKYIHQIQNSIPKWLLETEHEVKIPINLPTEEEKGGFNIDQFLDENPQIKNILIKTNIHRKSTCEKLEKERKKIGQQQKVLVLADLQNLKVKYVVTENDWSSLHDNILAQLRQLRRKIEIEVYDTENFFKMEKSLNEFFMNNHDNLLQELVTALAEYDNIVDKIHYPHLDDPLVKEVKLAQPISEATGLSNWNRQVKPLQRLKTEIGIAESDEELSKQLLPKVRVEAATWNPTARFCNALINVLTKQRLGNLLLKYPGEDTLAQVASILNSNSTFDFLKELSITEIDALVKTSKDSYSSELPALFQDKIELILSNIGVYISKEPIANMKEAQINLDKKIASDDFDIFMAYNSNDKEAVVSICGYLKKNGIYPWLDIEQVRPGEWFQDVIQKVIPKVRAAVIFIGKNGIGRWQALELRAFISQCVERKLTVIPIMLPGITSFPQDLLFLNEVNHVEFKKGIDEKAALEKLLWGITGVRP